MPIPQRKQGETPMQFVSRCMADLTMVEEYPLDDQRYAVCFGQIAVTNAVGDKVSMDYDGVLSTSKGKELAANLIENGATVYIISARSNKEPMLKTADDLNIPHSRVFAMGSNKAKIEKVKALGTVHYDNNPDVVKETDGELFT